MARKKTYKVKHFRSPYRKRNNKTLKKVLLITAIFLVFFVLAFFVLGPLTDSLYKKITTPDETSSAIDTLPSSEVTAEGEVGECYHTRYITEDEIKNTAGYSALVEKIMSDGYHAAVIPLRAENAYYFETKNEYALITKTGSTPATELITLLKNKNIRIIGSFETFKDYRLPKILWGKNGGADIDMIVRNKNNPTTYLSENNTNMSYLSPASEKTQNYLVSLLNDAAKTGVDEIIFKSFYFAEDERAMFSANDSALDKSALLKQTADALIAESAKLNIPVSFEIPFSELITLNQNKYGTAIFTDKLTVTADTLTDDMKTALENKTAVVNTLMIKDADAETQTLLSITYGVKKIIYG